MINPPITSGRGPVRCASRPATGESTVGAMPPGTMIKLAVPGLSAFSSMIMTGTKTRAVRLTIMASRMVIVEPVKARLANRAGSTRGWSAVRIRQTNCPASTGAATISGQLLADPNSAD